jgi:DNA-directed RNA polymerase sigma subunit (sigma70/sigma32)
MGRFDAAQGVQFETFATQRIRGAMLDELRNGDWMSRGDRKQQRQIEAAVHKLEQQYGRAPAESEIAKEMGVSLTDYQEILTKVRGTQLVHLEDMRGDEGDDRLPRPPRGRRSQQPAGHAERPPHARSAGRRHQAAARARAVRDEHVLRARHELEGNRRRAEGDRKPRVPTAQPEHRAAALEAAGVVSGQMA